MYCLGCLWFFEQRTNGGKAINLFKDASVARMIEKRNHEGGQCVCLDRWW